MSDPKSAPGRNDSCPCGSGKKYKNCCIGRPHDDGPCDGPVAPREADYGEDKCSRVSCGALECRTCKKRYAHCHEHHEEARTLLLGHVMRVHPETLSPKRVLAIANDPEALAGLLQQRARAPHLWEHFFAYVEKLRWQYKN